MTGDCRDDTASEARDLVRRAAGDVSGLTVKGQIRQAAKHLGYDAGAWRVREAWYRRAAGWSAAALDDLRQRFRAWRKRQAAEVDAPVMALRVARVRRAPARLSEEVDALAGEVRRLRGSDA